MRVHRPHATVALQRVGHAVVAVRLLHVRPCPCQRHGHALGRVGHGNGFHLDGIEHGIAVRRASHAAAGKRRISERLERHRAQVRGVGAIDEERLVVGGVLAGGKHASVGLQHQRGLAGALRGDELQRCPADALAAHARAERLELRALAVVHRIARGAGVVGGLRQDRHARGVLGRRNLERGFVGAVRVLCLAVDPGLLVRIEEGEQRVEVLLRHRVELVVVAARAAERQAKERGAHRGRAVHRVFQQVFRVDRPALVARHVRAVEAARRLLLHGGVRDQVAGHLLHHEAVVGHVVAEGLEHPVAPEPHLPAVVLVDAAGVRVARHVEPRHGHPLRVARAIGILREEAVHQLLVRVGALVGEEGRGLLGARRQAGEVQVHTTAERRAVSLGAECDARALERRLHEAVDGRARPRCIAHRGQRGLQRRHERPVLLVVGALGDPLPQDGALRLGDRVLAAVGRRHHLAGAGGGDPLHQERLVGPERDDGGAVLARRRGGIEGVEPEAGLLLGAVGPVAEVAAVGEDRADVAAEADGLGGADGERGHGLGACAGLGGRQ